MLLLAPTYRHQNDKRMQTFYILIFITVKNRVTFTNTVDKKIIMTVIELHEVIPVNRAEAWQHRGCRVSVIFISSAGAAWVHVWDYFINKINYWNTWLNVDGSIELYIHKNTRLSSLNEILCVVNFTGWVDTVVQLIWPKNTFDHVEYFFINVTSNINVLAVLLIVRRWRRQNGVN